MQKPAVRRICILLSFVLCSTYLLAQVPGVRWQKSLGGSSLDFQGSNDTASSNSGRVMIKTAEGGYLVGGNTYSNNGDVSGNHGASDLWIVKLDSSRNIVWQKCLGGSSDELFGSVKQTVDHGYIVIGSTRSNNGDVSGNHGSNDVWVVKLNSTGNIVWQKCLGGTRRDFGWQVEPTSDGGYILAGQTSSLDGDVSGLHGTIDSTDAWVVKLNSTGGLVWQKCLGGTSEDAGYQIKELPDGGFLMAGEAGSTNGDAIGNHSASFDIFVVRLNSTGGITWNKCFGGTKSESPGSLVLTADGGSIIAGCATSNDGDVSGNHNTGPFNFINDGWVLKINASGIITWQKCLGGTGNDVMSDVEQAADGSFIVFGHTGSSDGDVTGIRNSVDFWLVRLNSTGTLLMQKPFGGSGEDIGVNVDISGENEYLVVGDSWSNNGDVSGNHGSSDLWIAKLGAINTVKGIVYDDINRNGIKDPGEVLVTGVVVKTAKPGYEKNSVTYNGAFKNETDTGNYVTTVTPYPYYTSVPATKNSNFATYNNVDSFSFALQPIPGQRDLTIVAMAVTAARPGFAVTYKIIYKNAGTDTVSAGTVLFKKDNRLNFISANPPISAMVGDTLKWNYTNLKPFDTASIIINFQVPAPPVVNINDTLSSLAIINPVTGDLTPLDNAAVLKQRVIGSFDPNDKVENFAGRISPQAVTAGTYINYLVRFQNTGTDTAFSITVRDTLDTKLDWSSLQFLGASHPYVSSISNQNMLSWVFSNIKLVDSFHNAPASHGYILYRVKPKTNLVLGDTIKNTASIYFDFNQPVQTNRQTTVVGNDVVTGIGNVDNRSYAMTVFPNPYHTDILWLKVKDPVQGQAMLTLMDMYGRTIYRENLGRVNLANFQKEIELKHIPGGVYIIHLRVNNNIYSHKLIVL